MWNAAVALQRLGAPPQHPASVRPPSRMALVALFVCALLPRLWVADGGDRHRALSATALRSLCTSAPEPSARRLFDGHEGAVGRALAGCGLDDAGPAFWPGQRALWWGVGALARAVAPPGQELGAVAGLWLPLCAGALTVPALAVAVGRRRGRAAGLRAGLLLAVLPVHVAWSTSTAPVVLPVALLIGAVATRRVGLALLLAVLAASMRAELGLAAVLWLGVPGLPAAVLGAALLLGGAPDWGGHPLDALAMNAAAAPLMLPAGAALMLVAAAAIGAGSRRRLFLLCVLPLPFFDFGLRHWMLPLVLACGEAGRLRPALALALGLSCAAALPGLGARWLRDPPAPLQLGLPRAPPAACVEISDEPPIEGQPHPSFAGVWRAGCAALRPVPACLVWAEGPEHRRWQSRGLDDRAAKMRALFALEPVAMQQGGPGPWRLWHRLHARDGAPLDACKAR